MARDVKRAEKARDIRALIALLDPAATAVADGGGLVSAALHPIEGAETIARYLVGLAERVPGAVTFLERSVDGQPGLVAQQDGVTVTVFAFDLTGDRIARVWAVPNPATAAVANTVRPGRAPPGRRLGRCLVRGRDDHQRDV